MLTKVGIVCGTQRAEATETSLRPKMATLLHAARSGFRCSLDAGVISDAKLRRTQPSSKFLPVVVVS